MQIIELLKKNRKYAVCDRGMTWAVMSYLKCVKRLPQPDKNKYCGQETME